MSERVFIDLYSVYLHANTVELLTLYNGWLLKCLAWGQAQCTHRYFEVF